ncbi:fumarylacetoacetate hydrolase family protein [Roseobacter litoralis]|uniref:fumarylacetoacetate hydrolase family protein n=1 Tax=Roseobacter litoralis TaxID=42443 RepID=UPI0024954508|nr:fumarylacetoacetate hydrolase family protein [Roseobacter litoralis]
MSDFVIPVPPTACVPVASGGMFPVRRVYCIGRNYAAHAVEMGHDPDREAPFFFQKNPDDLNTSGSFPYPAQSSDVHHEAEVAVFLKSGGTNISLENALDHVYGYALCLDMTRRDLQGIAKKAGRPWEIGKAFHASAPVGPVHRVAEVGHLDQGRITLHLNGALKQEGDLNQMIWKVPEMISYLSEYYTLAPGDVILSGTPAGVGPVQKGDAMTIEVEGLGAMAVTVT